MKFQLKWKDFFSPNSLLTNIFSAYLYGTLYSILTLYFPTILSGSRMEGHDEAELTVVEPMTHVHESVNYFVSNWNLSYTDSSWN